MPVRIGQVTPWVVRIERVAAMYAGLGLGLGFGLASHTRQGRPQQQTPLGLPGIRPASDGLAVLTCLCRSEWCPRQDSRNCAGRPAALSGVPQKITRAIGQLSVVPSAKRLESAMVANCRSTF